MLCGAVNVGQSQGYWARFGYLAQQFDCLFSEYVHVRFLQPPNPPSTGSSQADSSIRAANSILKRGFTIAAPDSLAEYLACEAENAAESAARACMAHPGACALAVAAGVAVALQPELAPVLLSF
jgi:hypothetical protein